MANIPSNLSYGTVTGRFILAYADSADSGSEPDAIPAAGKIYFKASPAKILDSSASPAPVTILPAVVEATLDSEGYLCGYGTTRGIILTATNDTDANPINWTWTVSFQLTDADGTAVNVDPFSFSLPGGTTVDLTSLSPVPAANGTYYLVGPTGATGPANSLSIGTITTGSAGSSASATITGTAPSQTLSLTIPRGDQGIQGIQGVKGDTGNTGATGPANTLSVGTVTTGNPGSSASVSITGTSPTQTVSFTIPRGDVGQPNSLAIGTVTTGNSGDPAGATITGSAPSQTLNLTIPRGIQGIQGPAGNLGNLSATLPIVYNSTTSTISFDPSGYTFTGQALGSPVRNTTGSDLTKGQVVYFSGSNGNNALISLSQANSEVASSKTAGLLFGDLTNNNNGYIVTQGLLTNVNTAGLTEGAAVYLSPSIAGGMTSTKPSAPNHLVTVGFCVKAHATTGQIYVRIANGFELEELHNVSAGSPSNGDLLKYNNATSLWENSNIIDGGAA
jgi:hypothetical protein